MFMMIASLFSFDASARTKTIHAKHGKPYKKYDRPHKTKQLYHKQRKLHKMRRPYRSRHKETFYVGAILGYAEPTSFKVTESKFTSDEGSPTYGMSCGFNINDYFRVGAEITHRHKRNLEKRTNLASSNVLIDKTSLKSTSVMLNTYVMLPHQYIKPYFVIGAGVSYNSFGNITTQTNAGTSKPYKSASKGNFAYQVGAGVSFDRRQWSYDGEVKYIDRGTAETTSSRSGDKIKAHLNDIMFSMGIKYNFDW